MSPVELAALIISAATNLKAAGMTLEEDPSEDFNALATLVAIAYAENEQGENIGSGQSREVDDQGKREVSFGPFQINEFWYKDHTDSGDVTVVNNEYTDVFKDASRDDMINLLQDPYNSAVAAVIVANSNKGYKNWSTYTSDVYGIKDKDFNSKYWQTGFSSATEKFYSIEDENIEVNVEEEKLELEKLEREKLEREKMEREKMEREKLEREKMQRESNPTSNRMPVFTPQGPLRGRTPVYTSQAELEGRTPSLGMENREKGYSEREIASFKRGVDKIATMMNKVNPQNPETQRQASLWLADQMGMDIQEIPLDIRSNYDKVDTVILNFIGELGKAKAR
jgi:hypothetical protein